MKIVALLALCCIALNTSLNLSEPQVPLLQSRGNKGVSLPRLGYALNGFTDIIHPAGARRIANLQQIWLLLVPLPPATVHLPICFSSTGPYHPASHLFLCRVEGWNLLVCHLADVILPFLNFWELCASHSTFFSFAISSLIKVIGPMYFRFSDAALQTYSDALGSQTHGQSKLNGTFNMIWYDMIWNEMKVVKFLKTF